MNSTLLPAMKTANMTPPPTKAQLLRAAAVALHEKRTNTYRQLVTAEEECQKKLEQASLKLLCKTIKSTKPEHFSTYTGSVSMTFGFKKEDQRLSVEFGNWNAAKKARENARPGSIDEVHAELRGSVGRDEMTVRLLSDPKIKAELLAGAEKILATPTASDKVSAINV